MDLISFYGKTPNEAFEKAKSKYGNEVLIVETKLISKKNDIKDALYEVKIILPNENSDEEIKRIKEELKNISNNINILQQEIISVKNQKTIYQTPQTREKKIPELFDKLIKSGIKQNILKDIYKETIKYTPKEIISSNIKFKEFFYKLLSKLVKFRDELSFESQKILMLVGPTGVGKTTTIAKIAAIALLKKRFKIGIITLDSYRVGGVEQLSYYAKIMNLEIKSVKSVENFEKALEEFRDKNLILIDTAGSSPKDSKKLSQIYQFLEYSKEKITINLVLSTNIKYEDQLFAYKNFSFLNIDSLIFTKLDETTAIGNIFSLIYELKKPVSFFCIGQEVPEDILQAEGKFLIDCILKGFDESSTEVRRYYEK